MEENKKLGKNAEIELDESGVEQVAGGLTFSDVTNKVKEGWNYLTGKATSAAGAINNTVQTGNELVNTVQTGVDTVCQTATETKDSVSNIL